jgi:hypothetical protein
MAVPHFVISFFILRLVAVTCGHTAPAAVPIYELMPGLAY